LRDVAIACGLYTDEERAIVDARAAADADAVALAASTSVRPARANPVLVSRGASPIAHAMPAIELAKRNEVTLAEALSFGDAGAHLTRDVLVTADLEIKYAGYFAREREAVARMQSMAGVELAPDLPYDSFRSLSVEARQKLARIRPATLAQASRIPGVSPSDLQNLVVEIERLRRLGAIAAATG
jgi:tRNA uridine 5-carboxymethylaminomethyl modification enzyme